jgi:NAD(P)-dependent dehydrogenase (short-subunit alcohol dehydrogenase family)
MGNVISCLISYQSPLFMHSCFPYNHRLILLSVAFVTGAASGIGRACVQQLIRDGCTRLLITDIQKEALDETATMAKQISPLVEIEIEVADITSDGMAEKLVKKTATRFGRLDYGLNVAGIPGKHDAVFDTESDWDRIHSVNAKAVWLCERAEIQQLLKQEPLPTQYVAMPNCDALFLI